MYCDCPYFRQDLVNLSKEILANGNGKPQWIIFQQFLSKYIKDDINGVISKTSFTTSCSLKICSLLAHKLDELRRDMALSTLLVDLMTLMHLDFCSGSNVNLVGTQSFSSNRETLKYLGALRRGDDFKKILLNFGFLSSLSGDSSRLLKELECNFNYFMFSIKDRISITELDYRIKAAMTLVKRIFSCFKGREGNKRMFLAILAIHATRLNLLKDFSFTEKYVSWFEMYFTGTRDTYLSVFEVGSMLYVCLKLMNKLNLFNLYCQEFDNIMPGCPVKMEPRKLTHLTRCQIRQSLNLSNLPMPTAVDKLLLPKNLKRYLLGEVLDISRKKENTSSPKALSQLDFELLIRHTALYRSSK